jgi:transcriptional regulator with XRE-family HTH domain
VVRVTEKAGAHNPQSRLRSVHFGHTVREARKALHLSQEKLAERVGCDRQSINRIENAAYSPNLDRLFRLSDALQMGLAELVGLAEVDHVTAQRWRNIPRAMGRIGTETRKAG